LANKKAGNARTRILLDSFLKTAIMNVLFVVRDIDIEHLSLMLFSSILKNAGHTVDVCSAQYCAIARKLYRKNFSIVGYSVPTVYASLYLRLNEQVKQNFTVFSVFGGPHPTAVPEIIEKDGVDGICIGEGEYAMLELVENMSSGRPITNIQNWWIKENGKIFKNPLRPLISNLDNLPFPDRDLFKKQRFFDSEKIHIITGRGCPYSCSYCCHSFYNLLYEGEVTKIRKRSVENVIEEIRQFKSKFPLKFVMFDDDILVLPFEWFKEFCLQYKKYINIPFFCYLRPDLITPNTVRLLKSSGCHSVSMGLETADDSLRNVILKRDMSKEQIIEAARLIKEYKIRLKTSNIIGIPGSFLDQDIETIKLNIKCGVDYSSVEFLKPYPKTKISALIQNGNHSHLRKNLRYLFALTIEYPFLLKVIKILIRLPLCHVYKLCYLFWEGYASYFRLYPRRWRGLLWGGIKYIRILRGTYD